MLAQTCETIENIGAIGAIGPSGLTAPLGGYTIYIMITPVRSADCGDRPLWDPAAEDWPVPWTKMVELKSEGIRRNSKAFLSVLAEVSLWTPLLSGCWPRWVGSRRSRPSKVGVHSRI